MTNREFFNAIVTMIDNGTDGIDVLEIKAHAEKEIEKLDARNANRSSKPTKAQVENEAVKLEIIKFLGEHNGATAAVIANGLDISVQKASALCLQLVKDGRLTVEDVKVPKKGKQKAYTPAGLE